jgi:sugar/nucleoside kinase (ribokinase family)
MVGTVEVKLDLLAAGETLVDFIFVEQTARLRNPTFRSYLGGSPANMAVNNLAKLGGDAAVISKTGIGAFAQFAESELQSHGVAVDYPIMYRRTTVAFVPSTGGRPDREIARSGDSLPPPCTVRPERLPGRCETV